MIRYLMLAAALCACAPRAERVDSSDAAMPAIDTLKPVTATDTAAPRPTVSPTPPPAGTQTKLGRDSAFSPPRNIPKLDTVPTKRPPR
jgi:hypothetical protein